MHSIAESQKAGGLSAFIDAEHAFDKRHTYPNCAANHEEPAHPDVGGAALNHDQNQHQR